LIKILFNHINDKSPIHANKTVVSVQSLEDRAIITARDGSCFSCDLVAGADGVYSVIRQEINSIKPVTHDPKCKIPFI
jgi:2-polyprenyl-6-methoxyphenol hydroxylase-like FAD-dependent oxidoreductase